MSGLGPIIQALAQFKGRESPAYSFNPDRGNVSLTMNSAFLVTLAGSAHPDFERARNYLESMANSGDWEEAARFYLEGEPLIRRELAEAERADADFSRRFDRLSEWVSREQNLADVRTTAERFWSVFFPEANGILSDRKGRLEALRAKRRVSVTKLNPSPLTDPARELLFASNVLLTVPPEERSLDALPLSDETKKALARTRGEPQLFWYDHPIQVGVEPAQNEILHGLGGLEETLEFEREHGRVGRGSRPVCVLSVSVTHSGLRDLARGYVREELARSGIARTLDVYAFTEADTRRIISEVLGPAAARYLLTPDAERHLGILGVDGEYGRHYSFLKAVAAFWQVFIDPGIRATFKIDLDQVFPQRELVAETGLSAMEHFQTPLWGARGLDTRGRPVELGLIAGALVNEKDIAGSLFTCDVPFPDEEPSVDEFFFFSPLPQALSTEAEMMVRYDPRELESRRVCLERVHVTGGTTGILVDSLRRHRPFTPSFVGRAEDQAYVMSTLKNPGPRLAYLHKDGLIMRHDKEAFARDAMAAAFIGKLIGDLVRVIHFSAYARALAGDVGELKELIDPFTGCFVSSLPATIVYLRLAFKAASFFAAGRHPQGVRFIRDGSRRIGAALRFAGGEESPLKRTLAEERSGWDLFYETLSAVEKGLMGKDGFALDLRRRARAIIRDCALSPGRSL